MNRIPVKSSDIRSIGWEIWEDNSTKKAKMTGVLEVEYTRNNIVYRYIGVPERIYHTILADTESIGKAVARLVKAGNYPFAAVINNEKFEQNS